ncbi:endothelin-2-like isoform X2 [Hyperolius riggenbachi]|uniref:endothelin-2-like isoform X2 n=1 Tax=Hyperolius riggenbachi TaxID=752182 RepID=UPI0035A29461
MGEYRRTIPYGLGSPRRRRRRTSARCLCDDVKDKTCTSFCYKEPWNITASNQRANEEMRAINTLPNMKKSQAHLLRILRDVASYRKSILYYRQGLASSASKLPSTSVFWKKKR